MKTYKIIISLVWAALVALSPVRGQAVVHDPVHMGSNVVGFGQQLEEALAQTQQFFEIIDNTKKQFKSLETIREATQKVSQAIYLMSELEDIATLAVHTIQSITNGVKIISSGELQPYELSCMLELYSNNLRKVNNCILSTKKLISDFKDAYGKETGSNKTEKEREEGIKENKHKIMSLDQDVTSATYRVQSEIEMRANMTRMIRQTKARDMIKAASNLVGQAQPMDPKGVMSVPNKYDISSSPFPTLLPSNEANAFKPEITGANEKDMQTKYKALNTPAVKLFYAISAIVAVIGALRVLQIFNQGNDISKTIVSWGGTSLFLVIVGALVQFFFH